MGRTDTLLLLGILGTGCTSVLGIDGDYVTAVYGQKNPSDGADAGLDAAAAGGGKGSGGSSGGGGKGSGGRVTGSGGKPAELCGASLDGGECLPNEKCCSFTTGLTGTESACIEPTPIVGCGLDSCDACPEPPENAVAVCKGTQCGIQCADGFVENAGACEPQGTGGRGGATGTGSGGAAQCDPVACSKTHKCNIAGPLSCCLKDNTCGCTWAPGAVCY